MHDISFLKGRNQISCFDKCFCLTGLRSIISSISCAFTWMCSLINDDGPDDILCFFFFLIIDNNEPCIWHHIYIYILSAISTTLVKIRFTFVKSMFNHWVWLLCRGKPQPWWKWKRCTIWQFSTNKIA